MNAAYNCDCLDFMREYPDKYFDLCVADPPYGRGEDGGKNRSHYVKQKNGARLYVPDGGYLKKNWDHKIPDRIYFDEMLRISKHQIIFGVNYFDYPLAGGRIVWDKCNDGCDQSGAEIAYCSFNDRVDIVRYMWRGMMQGKSVAEGTVQQGNKALNEIRIHPTQKPVALYAWIFGRYVKPGFKVFDPFLGSQSSRIAAYDAGLDFIGCEIDPDIFADGERRYQEHTAQMSLFV